MAFVEHLPVIVVVNLLFFSYLMPIFYRWRTSWCAPATVLAMSVSFLLSLYLVGRVYIDGPFTYALGGWAAPWGIEFYIDYLAVYMLATITGIGLLIIVYGSEDLTHELRPGVMGWYYTLYLLLIASMAGMALTNDFFNLFVFMEISAIAACAIISIKESRECIEASFKYLILSAVGSGCFLLSVALLYMITGNLNMTFVAQELTTAIPLYPNNVLAALGLMTVAFCVKSALFPLHVWLPDAHSAAPSPSSAILSGLVIKIYAVALVKIFFQVFPLELFETIPLLEVLLWLSTLAIILGSVFAIVQEDLKKLLAYSSIAQIGYVFLGIGLFAPRALTGGLLHIFNHAVMKSMLFLIAGIIIYTTGTRKISDFSGIGMRMPVVMGAFTIGAASMVGIPLTGGFISKLYLAMGALDIGRPLFVIVLLFSSLLNGLYYFPIAINAFLGERPESAPQPQKVPMVMLVPVVILAFLVFFFGVFPVPLLSILEKAVGLLLNS